MFGLLGEPPFRNRHYSPLMARNKPDGGGSIIVE